MPPVVRVEGSTIRIITLDRPASRNAFDGQLLKAVLSEVRQASANSQVRALVLTAGLPAARAYLLTGDRVPAGEAHRLGLVHRTVPPERVVSDAIQFAERLAGLPVHAVNVTGASIVVDGGLSMGE